MSSPCGSHVLRHLLSFLLLGQGKTGAEKPPLDGHSGRDGRTGAPEGNHSQGRSQVVYYSQGQQNPGLTSLLEEVNGISKTWPSVRSPTEDLFRSRQEAATQNHAEGNSTVSDRHDSATPFANWDIPELASLAQELAVDLVKAGSSKAAGGTVSDSGDQCLCASAVASPALQVQVPSIR